MAEIKSTNKYEIYRRYKTIDGSTFPLDEYYVKLVDVNVEECGYVEPTYEMRKMEGEYLCDFETHTKYEMYAKYVSYDSGDTWSLLSPMETERGDVVQYDSPDCIEHFTGKFKAYYNNSTSYSVDCDSSSAVTTADTRPSGYDFSAMTSAVIGNCVTSIGEGVFSGCTSLSSCTIGDSVTSIGIAAFEDCSGLTTVNIPSGVTSIGNFAFGYCRSLTSITIPSSITYIGSAAFTNCDSLPSITIEATTPPALGNLVFPNNCTIYVPTCSLVSTYASASGWSSYASRITALDCPPVMATFNVTDTTNPTQIANITSGFSSIEVDGVVQPSVVSSYTFSTTGEHTVNYDLINDTSINVRTFFNCTSLTSINIPDTVTNIGSGMCSGCTSLSSVTIGSNVTTIGNHAFHSCSGLTSIVIPSGVTSINDAVFKYCTSLTSIEIPSGVTSIGSQAFYYCSGLTSINIPSGVTSIGSYAFYECNSLTSINIPSGVTYIGSAAFTNCGSLTSITIPSGVTIINISTFDYCGGLTSIIIPDTVTSIGDTAFLNCTGLTSCTIGNGVTSIGFWAFRGCSSLTSIVIPSGVTSIGSSAFRDCTSLTSVTCLATTPPTLGDTVLNDTNNCPIYVLATSLNTYKSASGWSNYANRIQAIP